MLRTMIVLLLVAATVSAEDSPLVALAKRTNRKASKTPVITNETVARSKGRLSMAGGETPRTQPTLMPASTATPESSSAASPSYAQGTAAAATVSSYPSSTVRNVEPQSSARTVASQSTARTVEPSSLAGRIEPQSSAQTVRPEITAQTIRPESTAQTIQPPQR